MPSQSIPEQPELRRQTEYLQRIAHELQGLRQLMEQFTDSGASFRATQVDPITIAYLMIVGQVLGDRLDGQLVGVKSSEEYRTQFMRAAALLARDSLQVVDEYRTQQAPLQALEEVFKSDGRA